MPLYDTATDVGSKAELSQRVLPSSTFPSAGNRSGAAERPLSADDRHLKVKIDAPPPHATDANGAAFALASSKSPDYGSPEHGFRL